MIKAYYNEWDPKVASWLRQLIKNGDITDGEVDERNIIEVEPADIKGFTRIHWFAGIAVWDYALNIAGWTNQPVWTASLPCQPFSSAGKRLGVDDERHILPYFIELIRRCKPETIFGEQVSSAAGPARLRNQTQDLHTLSQGKATNGIQAQHKRHDQSTLHQLQSEIQNSEPKTQGISSQELQQLAIEEARTLLSKSSIKQGKNQKPSIRHHARMGAGKDRSGLLRNNWATFRPNHTACMERTVIRPDRQQFRLPEIQHQSSYLRCEYHDEYMGRTENPRCISINHGTAQEQISFTDTETNGPDKKTPSGSYSWLDDLQASLEAENYAIGHCILGAHSVNAPHQRQRLYWVADNISNRSQRRLSGWKDPEREIISGSVRPGGATSWMVHTERKQSTWGISGHGQEFSADSGRTASEFTGSSKAYSAGNIIWIWCKDGKYRPVKSSIKPLVTRTSGQVVHSSHRSREIEPDNSLEARTTRLKGYGNSLQAQTATVFIRSFLNIKEY